MAVLHSNISGQGAPLIILHGFLGMGDNWRSMARLLDGDFEVHLLDQRNHGRSFHTDDFSYELMVSDLLDYIEHHKLGQVHLLGHSMGGKTAMLFAVNKPEMVLSLMVADIAPRFYPQHHQNILEALTEIEFDKISSRNEIDESFKKHISEFGIRQFLLKNVYRKTKSEFDYRFNLKALVNNIDEIGVSLPTGAVFMGKTLFLKGENSGYIANSDEKLIRTHFPKAKITIISKAGHWLHAENQQEFFESVVEFIRNA